MATFTLTFDTGAVPLSKITDAFASAYDYDAVVDGAPNPETKAQFTRRMIRHLIVQVVRGQDAKAAATAVAEISLT